MEFVEMLDILEQHAKNGSLISGTISQPRAKSDVVKRVKLKAVELKGLIHIQFEYQMERTLTHENVPADEVRSVLDSLLHRFKQLQIELTEEDVHIQISKKYKIMWKSTVSSTRKQVDLSHNRKKNYLLDESKPYPFLVRLGIQMEDGRVKKQKYDKFRQINRFLEFIEDSLDHLPKDRTIRILDFGSGKSYLTFALYHYLHIEKGFDLQVTGLDLKKEVIEECQRIASDLNYEQLNFLVGDINEYNEETAVDMVVTLHACDTATDMALTRAVKWGARVILSVPCCQHELSAQLQSPELSIMLKHGLIKERFSALATDSMRAELLTFAGYETQLLEFIDLEHTPKNILIRAYYTGKQRSTRDFAEYTAFRNLLDAKPYLEKELADASLLLVTK